MPCLLSQFVHSFQSPRLRFFLALSPADDAPDARRAFVAESAAGGAGAARGGATASTGAASAATSGGGVVWRPRVGGGAASGTASAMGAGGGGSTKLISTAAGRAYQRVLSALRRATRTELRSDQSRLEKRIG